MVLCTLLFCVIQLSTYFFANLTWPKDLNITIITPSQILTEKIKADKKLIMHHTMICCIMPETTLYRTKLYLKVLELGLLYIHSQISKVQKIQYLFDAENGTTIHDIKKYYRKFLI